MTRLVDVARSRGEMLRSPIVLVGGTALAGWKVRAHSRDVDIYMPEIIRAQVEQAILDEESMLERVAGLLESQSDLAAWTEESRSPSRWHSEIARCRVRRAGKP